MRTFATLALAALVATVALVAAAPAVAGDDDDIIRRGSCSGATDWKLKLDHDDGRIEAEFEVDQNRNGERWRVVLRRDGNRFFKGVRTTHGPQRLVRGRAEDAEPRRLGPDQGAGRQPAKRRSLQGRCDDLAPCGQAPAGSDLPAGAVPAASGVRRLRCARSLRLRARPASLHRTHPGRRVDETSFCFEFSPMRSRQPGRSVRACRSPPGFAPRRWRRR